MSLDAPAPDADADTARIHIPYQYRAPGVPPQPQHGPPAPKKRRLLWVAGAVVAVVAVLVALVGLSATKGPAAKLCSALANGAVPYVAVGQAYSDFGQPGQAAQVLRRAASDIRSTCPERESVAQSAEALAALSEGRLPFAMPASVGAPETSTAPTIRNYELRITGSAKRATVYYGVAGSSGGGDAVSVPWSKNMSDSSGGYSSATLSATTDMGSKGDLTCSIVDTDTGTVLDTKTAASQGGSYGYASVSCSASS